MAGCNRLRPSEPTKSRARNGLALIRKGPHYRSVARNPHDIAAGQRPPSPPEPSRPQGIALTLRIISVFPMTHHVECVALLTKTGSDLR